MFSSKADFSGISGSRDLIVSGAIHKAVLEVSEYHIIFLITNKFQAIL